MGDGVSAEDRRAPDGDTKPLPWSTNVAAEREARLRAERERQIMISYPFPMDDGYLIANLRLPKRLTRADAERLKNAVDTLVRDE